MTWHFEVNKTFNDISRASGVQNFKLASTYEVLEVDPMHDPGSRWNDRHVLEGRVDPLQELEPLLVPLHLSRPVLLQRRGPVRNALMERTCR